MASSGFGRYRVVGELGRGGMGVVYRAHDPELDREVAVKHIQLPVDASRELRVELEKRFRREAKAAARIRHPGVVAIHDVGVTDSGLYLVMELVEGESLAHRLERGAFLDRAAAIEVAVQAAEALAAAHRAGVVHRDVKPANILLSADGRVLLTDFGVARSLDEVSELTRTGMVVGSPAYMAPEQLRGAAVDGRADLFSLGVVLYELLLRKRPFPAQSITTLLYQILHEDPLADPAISRELEPGTAELLRRLLAKQPEQRPADAAGVATALRELPLEVANRDGEAVTRLTVRVPPILPPTPAAPSAPTPPLPDGPSVSALGTHAPYRLVVLLAGGALLAALVVVAAAVALWNHAPPLPVVRSPRPSGWTPGSGPLPEPSLAPVPPAPTPTPLPLVAAATVVPVAPHDTPLAPTAMPPAAAPAESEAPPAATPPPPPAPPTTAAAPPRAAAENPSIELRAKSGVELDVDPDDAEVFVDGRDLGTADDVDTYTFPTPGRHLIRLVYPGYKPVLAVVVVTPDADDDDVELEVDMEEIPEP